MRNYIYNNDKKKKTIVLVKYRTRSYIKVKHTHNPTYLLHRHAVTFIQTHTHTYIYHHKSKERKELNPNGGNVTFNIEQRKLKLKSTYFFNRIRSQEYISIFVCMYLEYLLHTFSHTHVLHIVIVTKCLTE